MRIPRFLALPLFCFLLVVNSRAERGYVLVQVQDAQHKPVRKLEIGIEGFGASAVTGNDGKAKLPIGSAAVPGDSISLAVLHSPPGKDFVMISPWDNRAIVPSFEDKPANFIRVVVVQRGDRAALESNTVLLSLAAKINSANAPKQTGGQIPAQGPAGPADAEQEQVHDPKANLKAVAMEYGLDPTEVDEALKALGAKTTDPYEAGQIALYKNNYREASAQFQTSFKEREATLKASEQKVEEEKLRAAEAASFLGLSLLQQNKLEEAKQAVEEGLNLLPNNPKLLNDKGVIEEHSNDLGSAEGSYRDAIAASEKSQGPDNAEEAVFLENLAKVLMRKSEFAEAEALLRRTLALNEKLKGATSAAVVESLEELGILFDEKRHNEEAGKFFDQALKIIRNSHPPRSAEVATYLGNLGFVLITCEDYSRAEPLMREALEIDEKVLGPDSEVVAAWVYDLANILFVERGGRGRTALPSGSLH